MAEALALIPCALIRGPANRVFYFTIRFVPNWLRKQREMDVSPFRQRE
jgi:hypothetical protein